MSPLTRLHIAIDARVHNIRESHPDWPCAKGCDGCCTRLAEMPRLTAAEWELLREGLAALPRERLSEIGHAIACQPHPPQAPVVCPLLDRASGACPVYAQRPVACRTYGFYVQRDKGLYCGDIESRVGDGTLADVVWGNHDAIDHQLHELGNRSEPRSLGEWFADWERERNESTAPAIEHHVDTCRDRPTNARGNA